MQSRKQPTARFGSIPRVVSQLRSLRTAMDPYVEHGVGATSYQMIAEALGVTKGAINRQLNTKDEIIIAVKGMKLMRLRLV